MGHPAWSFVAETVGGFGWSLGCRDPSPSAQDDGKSKQLQPQQQKQMRGPFPLRQAQGQDDREDGPVVSLLIRLPDWIRGWQVAGVA
jgi:hypothetical protein